MPFLMDGKEIEVRVLKEKYKWNDDVHSWMSGPRPGSKFSINGRTLEYYEETESDASPTTKSK